MRTRAWAVTMLSLGLVIGSVVGAYAQGNELFLPAVATARLSQPTVRLVNVRFAAAQYSAFLGEVLNETTFTVRVHRIALYLLDGSGLPIGSAGGRPFTEVLPPGAKVPFKASCYQCPSWTSLSHRVGWDPVDHLLVTRKELSQTSSWDRSLTVWVQNPLSVAVHRPRVAGVLYTASGQVLACDQADGSKSPEALQPGETFSTTISFYLWYVTEQIAGYDAVAAPYSSDMMLTPESQQ